MKTREEYIQEWLDENANIFDESELDEMYSDFIDEVSGDIEIMGMTYCASKVLEEVDPIAYRCCFSDWVDGEDFVDHEDGNTYRQDDLDSAEEYADEKIEEEGEENE